MAHIYRRAQTEPVAALVAVAAVCLVVSLYAGVYTDTVSRLESDREVGQPTTERVWNDVSDSGVVYDGVRLDRAIKVETIPRGYYVTVHVSFIGSGGRIQTVAKETFDPAGEPLESPLARPDDAEQFQRPISVQQGPGKIRAGTLTVVVWE